MCESTKVPTTAFAKKIDTTLVASVRVNGPLGNVVSSFCSSAKLIDVQPIVAPNDAVNKFTAKRKV